MQKWEYMQVLHFDNQITLVNGKKLPKPYPNPHEYFNQLGREGWELVAVMNVTIAVFKRPLIAEGQ